MNVVSQTSAVGPLAGLSVVELGDGTAGPYAAKLLGDFGAEVVKVEGPEGDSTRRRGPFPDGRPDPEASGLFLYLNINKRGVVLDFDSEDGRRALDRLLAPADIFITNLPIERLQAAGVAPEELRARYPRLIVTTITPFGMKGPWAERRGDELVTYAMAGIAYSTPGMPDAANDLEREPPLHPACFAAETIAGLCAGLATLTARAGPGQDPGRLPSRCQPAGRGGVDAASRRDQPFVLGRHLQPPAQSHNDRPDAELLPAVQGRLRDDPGADGCALGAAGRGHGQSGLGADAEVFHQPGAHRQLDRTADAAHRLDHDAVGRGALRPRQPDAASDLPVLSGAQAGRVRPGSSPATAWSTSRSATAAPRCLARRSRCGRRHGRCGGRRRGSASTTPRSWANGRRRVS